VGFWPSKMTRVCANFEKPPGSNRNGRNLTFALGEAYFARRDCDSALPWYARVPKTDHHSVESVLRHRRLRLLLGQADQAEAVFTALQAALKDNMVSGADLPEILNDLAIAWARQGRQLRHKRNFAVRPNWILKKTTIHLILVYSRCRAMILPLRLIIPRCRGARAPIIRRTGRC